MKTKAFSLVELSIVLVILGLLLGGVLAGKGLIKSAELRNIITSFNTIKTATVNFSERYSALPGDMKNATTYWGQLGTVATCNTLTSTNALTCDGDGNGQIGNGTLGNGEISHYWQHLANAGMIVGSYTGLNNSTSIGTIAGTNVYALKRSRSGIGIYYWSDTYVSGYCGSRCFTTTPSNVHVLIAGANSEIVMQPFFDQPGPSVASPQEAYSVDVKIDDGQPATGVIFADNSLATGCTTTTAGVSTYLLTADDSFTVGNWASGCRIMFSMSL